MEVRVRTPRWSDCRLPKSWEGVYVSKHSPGYQGVQITRGVNTEYIEFNGLRNAADDKECAMVQMRPGIFAVYR